MIKTILAVIGALFMVLFLIGIGVGWHMSAECSNQSTTGSSEWSSCMDAKAADY